MALTGGEPLVCRDLPAIVDSLPATIAVSIDTNSLLVASRWSSSFQRVHHFSVSIDGPQHIHDERRGGFLHSIEAIDLLVRRGVTVGSTITIDDGSAAWLPETVRMLVQRGVSVIGLNSVRSAGTNAVAGLKLTLTNEVFEVLREAESICRDSGVIAVVGTLFDKRFFAGLQGPRLPSCFCGQYRATITHTGRFVPCHALVDERSLEAVSASFHVPSAMDDLTASLLASDLFIRYREATTGLLPEGCGTCPFKATCSHGCRPLSFMSNGSLAGRNDERSLVLSH